MNLVAINSIDDPRVAVYRNQKDQWLRAAHRERGADHAASDTRTGPITGTGLDGGRFMAESIGVLEQLVRSPYAVESLLINHERLGHPGLAGVFDRLDPGVPVYVAERTVLAGITGYDMHRGVLACGRGNSPQRWQDVAASCRALLVLEGLNNHDNVGGLFRTLAALGGLGPGDRDGTFADVGVLLSPGCCDPLYRKSLRVSMGWALRLPFAWALPWPGVLGELAVLGYDTLAMTPAAGAVDLYGFHTAGGSRSVFGLGQGLAGKPALVLGAEGPGLTPEAIAACAHAVRVPIDPRVDSLNVTVAGAVALSVLLRAE